MRVTAVVTSGTLMVLRRGLLNGTLAAASADGKIFAFLDAERVTKVLLREVGGHRLLLVLLRVNPIRQAGAPLEFLCLVELDNDRTVLTVVLAVELSLGLAQVGACRPTGLVLLVAIAV